jgi:uncharacterized protein (TIGR03083 family)
MRFGGEDMDIFEDLVAEQERLEAILSGLEDQAWGTESGAAGWSITDVVLHLAQTEEAVVTSVAGHDVRAVWDSQAKNLDDMMDRMVRADRAAPDVVFRRWQSARRAAVAALRQADPQQPLPWVATPLKPRTLRTYAT